MKNFIGGVFRNRQGAERVRTALRENGFDDASISVLECTHEKEAVVLDHNPSIQSIGKGALTGALILGGIGAFIGLLVGMDVIRIPGLEPAGGATLPFQVTGQYVLSSVIAGTLLGILTGAIIGAAVRLAMPKYRTVDTGQNANKGDLMLALQTNDMPRMSQARSMMIEHGAVRFEEDWDKEVWSVLDEETSQPG